MGLFVQLAGSDNLYGERKRAFDIIDAGVTGGNGAAVFPEVTEKPGRFCLAYDRYSDIISFYLIESFPIRFVEISVS